MRNFGDSNALRSFGLCLEDGFRLFGRGPSGHFGRNLRNHDRCSSAISPEAGNAGGPASGSWVVQVERFAQSEEVSIPVDEMQ